MKPFTRIAVVALWLIALMQLLRFILRWEVTLNGAPVPLWLSGLAATLAGGWRSWSGGNGPGKNPDAPRGAVTTVGADPSFWAEGVTNVSPRRKPSPLASIGVRGSGGKRYWPARS